MATQVLIAHTGQRLEVDTTQFSKYGRLPSKYGLGTNHVCSLDDLKAWVSRKSSIPVQQIIALTPQGRSVKFAGLHAEVSRRNRHIWPR